MENKTTIPSSIENRFISPHSGRPLILAHEPKSLYNSDELYQSISDVLILLKTPNTDYEGAYLNKVKYIPKADFFPFTLPLWMINNGYVWEVRKQFPKGSLICELGCASGVNYFGQRYRMIGIDYSLKSLQAIDNYIYKLQADAISLPFADQSLDGVISSYFWEHISPSDKILMLKEFHRVLKPGGKIVMLYDVETQNELINKLKNENLDLYEELFKRGDFHTGYETLEENEEKFRSASFKVKKHFGLERTMMLSRSVYIKLGTLPNYYGRYAKRMEKMTSGKLNEYLNMLLVRLVDVTWGRMKNRNKSRIAISVLEK